MNGPSAQALREGGVGGSLRYKLGTTVVCRITSGQPAPPMWKRKMTMQSAFGDFGEIIKIDIPEGQGTAYIEYEDKEDAIEAEREMKDKKICGVPVSVQVMTSQMMGMGGGLPRGAPVASGAGSIETRISVMAREHNLDEAAAARLVSVFSERARLGCDLNRDIMELSQHLAASNKPSALVSMKLAELRTGQPIGPCKYGKGSGKGGRPGDERGSDRGEEGRSRRDGDRRDGDRRDGDRRDGDRRDGDRRDGERRERREDRSERDRGRGGRDEKEPRERRRSRSRSRRRSEREQPRDRDERNGSKPRP
mmetsp:Transcript_125288/g.279522  ORF Transcript_125288/g.279522 Transcript_125288/m.279522 type:complete len:308 (-) Transcript_125288:243-1166(-)